MSIFPFADITVFYQYKETEVQNFLAGIRMAQTTWESSHKEREGH